MVFPGSKVFLIIVHLTLDEGKMWFLGNKEEETWRTCLPVLSQVLKGKAKAPCFSQMPPVQQQPPTVSSLQSGEMVTGSHNPRAAGVMLIKASWAISRL